MLTWQDFLQLASDPGLITIAVGILLSIIVEYMPSFASLPPKWKRVIFFGLSLAAPISAAILGVATLDWSPSFVDTFWPAIVAGVVSFGSGTLAHLPKLPDFPASVIGPSIEPEDEN